HLFVGIADPTRELVIDGGDAEVVDEKVLLVRGGAADARVLDLVGDVEVPDELVTLRPRAGEAALRPLERDRRLRDRERMLAAGGDGPGEAVPEVATVLAAGLEMPLDRPLRRGHRPPSPHAHRPPPSSRERRSRGSRPARRPSVPSTCRS